MPRRILVTGASGGLGLSLVREARARGYAVLATGRSIGAGARLEAMGAEFVAADLTGSAVDLRALARGCASVIHGAALSASWGARADFQRINVAATAALLEAARLEGCRRFVFVSSPSIFAAFRDRIGIGGDDEPSAPPLNDYARTKLEGERLVLAANNPQMATAAVRPRAIVGPDDKVLLPRLAALASRPWLPMPRGGRALIELTDVRDASDAILLAEDRIDRIAGRGVNVSGGRPLPIREIAETLSAALGRHPRPIELPMIVARIIALLAEGAARAVGQKREPVLTRYSLATLAYSQTFDLEETRRLIGFEPRHDALATLLEEGGRYSR